MSDFLSKLLRRSSKELESQDQAASNRLTINWILPQQLAVGPIPMTLPRQNLLMNEGFSSILTLCSETEGIPPESLLDKVRWSRIPLVDSHSLEPIDLEVLAQAVDQAHEYIQSYSPLYVHCIAGMERSPSVCVGYLCKYKGMPLWEALNWVKQANPRTNILDSQLKAIQQLCA